MRSSASTGWGSPHGGPLASGRLFGEYPGAAVEWGKILGEARWVERFPTAAAFASHTGTAPLPASSGETTRHQLNRALFTVATVQARGNPDARAYLERKRAEGTSAAEGRRSLKRHLARIVYDAMRADAIEVRLRAAA